MCPTRGGDRGGCTCREVDRGTGKGIEGGGETGETVGGVSSADATGACTQEGDKIDIWGTLSTIPDEREGGKEANESELNKKEDIAG